MKIHFGQRLSHRLAGDGLFGLACYGFSVATQFGFSLIAVKYLGADHYGFYAAAFVIVSAVGLLGSFCIEYKIIPMLHRLVKEEKNHVIPVLMRSALLLNIVLAGSIALTVFALKTPLATILKMGGMFEATLVAMLPVGIILALRSTLSGGVSAAGKVKWVFLATLVINRTGMIALAMLLYWLSKILVLPSHPSYLALAFTIAEAGGLLWMYLRWRNRLIYVDSKLKSPLIDWLLLKQLLSSSLPPLFHNIGGYANTQINKLLIGIFRTSTQLGAYHLVTIMTAVPFFPFQMFTRSYGPMASSLYQKKDIEGLRQLYKQNAFITVVAGLALALLLVFWGRQILSLYGDEFYDAYIPLIILALATILWIVPGSCGNTLLMLEKDKILHVTTVLTVIANITGAIMLIPKYGMVGAAYSSAAANLLRNVVLALYLYSKTGIHAFSANLNKFFFNSGLLIALYFILCSKGFELMAAIISTGLLLMLICVLLKPHFKTIMIMVFGQTENGQEIECQDPARKETARQ